MRVKCYVCKNHTLNGNKHGCTKCENKIVYGIMQEQIIDCCSFFEITPTEAKRRAYMRKIERLPIDDSLIGIRERGKNGRV